MESVIAVGMGLLALIAFFLVLYMLFKLVTAMINKDHRGLGERMISAFFFDDAKDKAGKGMRGVLPQVFALIVVVFVIFLMASVFGVVE